MEKVGYECDICGEVVIDSGPYEMPDGNYACLECYTDCQEAIIRRVNLYREREAL